MDISALRSVDGDDDCPTKKRSTRTNKIWDPTPKVHVEVAAENARLKQEMVKLQQSYSLKEKQAAERSSRALKQKKAAAAKLTSSVVTKVTLQCRELEQELTASRTQCKALQEQVTELQQGCTVSRSAAEVMAVNVGRKAAKVCEDKIEELSEQKKVHIVAHNCIPR